MNLTPAEKRTVLAVFTDLLERFTEAELNAFIGTETIREMLTLRSKLHYEGYCERRGIRYEDMTDEDFEDAAMEEIEEDTLREAEAAAALEEFGTTWY